MFGTTAAFKTIHSTFILTTIAKRYAGHSKWANIKHVKGLKDAQRGQLFSKLSRQIRVAITEGGSADPDKNVQLFQILQQARRANMPVATIQNALKTPDKRNFKSGLLEIKGPGKSVTLIEVFTDNLTRTRQQVQGILKKHNSILTEGTKHLFEQRGVIETEPVSTNGDVLEEATEHAILVGAEDVRLMDDNLLHFYCDSNSVNKVETQLEKLNYKILSGSVEYIPTMLVEVSDSDIEIYSHLHEKLEALEDVVKLHNNIQ